MADIKKIGLLVIRDGKILLCRKQRGTKSLILPGGKIEPGESAIDCLCREVEEELGGDVSVSSPSLIGSYHDVAAAESGPPKTVHIELYAAKLTGNPVPSSEIAELVWFAPTDDTASLAPSLRNKILPDLFARGFFEPQTK